MKVLIFNMRINNFIIILRGKGRGSPLEQVGYSIDLLVFMQYNPNVTKIGYQGAPLYNYISTTSPVVLLTRDVS